MNDIFEIFEGLMEGEKTVVDVDKYDDLLIAENERNTLLNLALNDLRVYNDNYVSMSGDAVLTYIKAVYPTKYLKRVEALREETQK